MKIDKILHLIREHRPISTAGLYRYFKTLDIKPAGASQRPQNYPHDTAARVLAHLGYATAPATASAPEIISVAQFAKELGIPQVEAPRMVSMKQLRDIRRRARGQKGGAK